MKKTKGFLPVLALSLLGGGLLTTNTFAANPYGIEYDGGAELGTSNVTVDPEMLNELTELVSDKSIVTSSESDRWGDAYYSNSGECRKSKYIKVSPNNPIREDEEVAYGMLRLVFNAGVYIKKVSFEGFSESDFNGKYIAINIDQTGHETLGVGRALYSDEACQNKIQDVFEISGKDRRVFVETEIKFNQMSGHDASGQLYFGLADIDSGQSYKVLDQDNLLSKNTMFVKDASALQPKTGTLKNMFVENGNYIYSPISSDGEMIDIESGADVFAKVKPEVLNEGLNIVFGFAKPEASGIKLYGKTHEVKYATDGNGVITLGWTSEPVLSEGNPSGATSTPGEGFVFSHWASDVDVKLTDGTTIRAGERMTPEQVKSVVVTQDVTFTAIHEGTPVVVGQNEETSDIAVPDTGAATGETNAVAITVSVMGVLAVALLARLAPRMFHKKMDFKK